MEKMMMGEGLSPSPPLPPPRDEQGENISIPALSKRERKRLKRTAGSNHASTAATIHPPISPRLASLTVDIETPIRIERIPELALWALGCEHVVKPTFADMTHRNSLRRLILLMAGGIDLETYRRQPSWLAGIRARCGPPLPVTLPKYDTSPGYQTNLLLRVPARQKIIQDVKKHRHLTHHPHPPDYYLLTLADMKANSFPLPTIDPALGIVTCPDGFVATQPAGELAPSGAAPGQPLYPMIALDCEMVTTERGMELARVTLVDGTRRVTLLDMLCVPPSPVLDYNTRYSGITATLLDGVSTTLVDAQQAILRLVASETILVGHSLENDFHSLKLIHPRVLDTSLLYPHSKGPPWKNSLRNLTEKFLKRSIQKGQHDSGEDALAALDLALLKIKHGPLYGTPEGREHPKEHVTDLLAERKRSSVLLDRAETLKRLAVGAVSTIVCDTDADMMAKMHVECQKSIPAAEQHHGPEDLEAEKEKETEQRASESAVTLAHFVWGALHDLEVHLDEKWLRTERPLLELATEVLDDAHNVEKDPHAETLVKRIDSSIASWLDTLPSGTVALVYTGQGDTARARKAHELRLKRMEPSVREELGLSPWSPDEEERFTILTQRVSSVPLFVYNAP